MRESILKQIPTPPAPYVPAVPSGGPAEVRARGTSPRHEAAVAAARSRCRFPDSFDPRLVDEAERQLDALAAAEAQDAMKAGEVAPNE